jgi:hypothetical protein
MQTDKKPSAYEKLDLQPSTCEQVGSFRIVTIVPFVQRGQILFLLVAYGGLNNA